MSKISNPPWLQNSDLEELLSLLSPAMIVGGAVRNTLLNLPISDIDIATELLPEKVYEIASEAGFKVIPTGIAHGTVTCVKENAYEVTTLRVDKETDGRHATVEFSSSWQDDAERRDFTINAMYSDFTGNVMDLVGGVRDLGDRKLRFIGDPAARIQEDYLRILRFFRFYAHYCSSYDEQSHVACLKFADKLKSISRERCTYEFLRMLDAEKVVDSLKLMSNEIFTSSGLPLPTEDTYHKLKIPGLSKLGKLATFSPTHELILSRQQARLVQQLQNLRPLNELADYVMWINTCDEIVMLDGIHLQGNNPQISIEMLDIWFANRFPLRGKDIVELGCQPGPRVSEMLMLAKQYFCQQPYPPSRTELVQILRTHFF